MNNVPYRHTLTRRQSLFWNHRNPDMQRWQRFEIMDRISEQAIELGYDQWRVFDLDEQELAWGMDTGHLVE